MKEKMIMKKLVTVFAACAIAGLAMAQTDSNIVGYKTVTLNQNYTILGFNFEDCGGGPLSLQEVIPYAEGMTANSAGGTADNIQIQNASGGYDTYFMCNGFLGKTASLICSNKWVSSVSGSTTPASASILFGKGAWYLSRATEPDFSIEVMRPFSLD